MAKKFKSDFQVQAIGREIKQNRQDFITVGYVNRQGNRPIEQLSGDQDQTAAATKSICLLLVEGLEECVRK